MWKRQEKTWTVVLHAAQARNWKGILTLQQKKSRLSPANEHKKALGCVNTPGETM
jgi:hypothetical protein